MAKKEKQLDIEEELLNKQTGELMKAEDILDIKDKVIIIQSKRPDGSIRIQQDFSNCTSMAEQHSAHLTDLNYLINKYKPDELAAYIAARAAYRREILGHDFSNEPTLQEAKNMTLMIKDRFEKLPEAVKSQFPNALSFCKFIDNPSNKEKMLKLGLLTEEQIKKVTDPVPDLKKDIVPPTDGVPNQS